MTERKTWALQVPDEPGPEVTHVRNRHGGLYRRLSSGKWVNPVDRPYIWTELITLTGPLTDATPRPKIIVTNAMVEAYCDEIGFTRRPESYGNRKRGLKAALEAVGYEAVIERED